MLTKRYIDRSWLRTLIRTGTYKQAVIISNWHGGNIEPRRKHGRPDIARAG